MSRWRLDGTNWEGRPFHVSDGLAVMMAEVEAVYPDRHILDGTVASKGHDQRSPTSDHRPKPYVGPGVVRAVDIGEVVEDDGLAIAEAIRESQDPRVKYVIHESRLFSSYPKGDIPPWTWRPYNGHPHGSHVHVSVYPTADNDIRAWDLDLDEPDEPSPPPEEGTYTMEVTRSTWKKGDRGQMVKHGQALLHAHGLGGVTGAIDGIAGTNTDKGVRRFQEQKGLLVDGVVGPQTWGALEDAS